MASAASLLIPKNGGASDKTGEAPGEGDKVPRIKHRVTGMYGRSCSTTLTTTQGISHLKVSQMSA